MTRVRADGLMTQWVSRVIRHGRRQSRRPDAVYGDDNDDGGGVRRKLIPELLIKRILVKVTVENNDYHRQYISTRKKLYGAVLRGDVFTFRKSWLL